MFYHDHSWGITRLNVYAGEAAGYAITDDTEKKLIADGAIPAADATLPLIVQDRTFVPDAAQLAAQDPTWDTTRWGSKGSFWYHHVYMPAQNPGDPSGMSSYGRWMYGPWFWPPASDTKYGPIPNPYYDPACDLDDPATWTYQTDPFCEPEQIPGTPNISAGMEQFNDTPIVNGVAYPKVTLEPKPYRLRMLNAANDRFFNFQWYVADPTQGNGTTEVALNPAELAAAQTDPTVSPTPVQGAATAGPDWVQIATEGGFLPAPVVVDGQQPTTWITDPTRFDVGNVDKHSLLAGPGRTGRRHRGLLQVRRQDPDPVQRRAGRLPGPGPALRLLHRRTGSQPGRRTDDPARVRTEHPHRHAGDDRRHPAGAGVQPDQTADGVPAQRSGHRRLRVRAAPDHRRAGRLQHRVRNVLRGEQQLQRPEAAPSPGVTGWCGSNDTTTFGFNTLKAPNAKMTIGLGPKALHDEMNSTTFDEFGRMQATMGIEAQPPTPGAQNVTLYPFINPATELIDATGLPTADVKVQPISRADDGTQIWRFTHNGVDTHPIHFHLYDVQADQPGHLGQHHHTAGCHRVGLEGHRADLPVGGHHRRAATDHPEGAVRGPERGPTAQPDDAARIHRGVQQLRRPGQPDSRPSPMHW